MVDIQVNLRAQTYLGGWVHDGKVHFKLDNCIIVMSPNDLFLMVEALLNKTTDDWRESWLKRLTKKT